MKPRISVLFLPLAAAALVLPAVPASATDPAPAVTLTANKSVYLAGQSAQLTSKITAHNLDWIVDFQYPGSTEWHGLCASLGVNDSVRNCTLGVNYNVKVRAVLIDDKGTQDTSDDTLEAMATRNLAVKATVATSPLNYNLKSGNYVVYPKTYKPTFRSTTYPAFPGGRCLRHQLQRHKASGWKTIVTTKCTLENSKGRVDWKWTGKHASGVKYRVRAVFAGDAANKANSAAFVYFRFR
ncbi:MAG: hypothetical protein ACJ72D_30775 [Marmoricola sp.]